MNVLVTGAAGFIGMHLLPRLSAGGHKVIAVVNPASPRVPGSMQRLGALQQLRTQIGEHQIELVTWTDDLAALKVMLRVHQPEVCIHLAGRSWVRESLDQPGKYEAANYRATMLLLEALHACRCRRVVLASSVMVYGPDAPVPYREDVLGSAPASPYGASKLACEVLLNTYHLLHNLETVSLRLFSVYGANLRRDCVPYLIGAAILKNTPFTVFGDGSSVRDYIEVSDVVEALVLAAESRQSLPALNIGSGRGTALIDLVHLMEKALGRSAQIVHKPSIMGELHVAYADITQAQAQLHWRPQASLEKGITKVAEWFERDWRE